MRASQETADDDEPSNVRKPLVVALVALILLAAGYATWVWGTRDPDPATLAAGALAATDLNDRARYASRLSLVQNPEIAVPLLRKVAAEAKDPEVLIPVLRRLVSFSDSDLTQFVKAMDHENKDVRELGYKYVRQYFGGNLPDKLTYDPDAPSANRSKMISKLLDRINNPPQLLPEPKRK